MSTPSMIRFLDVIFYPLEAVVSLFAYLFWMICWAVWQSSAECAGWCFAIRRRPYNFFPAASVPYIKRAKNSRSFQPV
jgi:hypothetical protein